MSCTRMGPSPASIGFDSTRPSSGPRCGTGVTVDVLRGVCSLLSVQLPKVLRVHEEGVSNNEVLRRAGLDPRQFLLCQAKSKGEAIIADHRRAPHIKVQESQLQSVPENVEL